MKLPISFRFDKKTKTAYFLALLLRDEKATAVIFEEVAGKVRVVGESEAIFSPSLEGVSEEEWLDTIDKAISQAEEHLPENVETQKTIFGVKEDWVEEAHIKKPYLVKLKKLSDSLGLTPIGFLVITEAIAHLVSKEEGAPVSAILVEAEKKSIRVSLLRAGKVIETRSALIEGSIVKTADTLLHHFDQYDVLPSRILLFKEANAKGVIEEFTAHRFSKGLPFLHVPQVTALEKGFDAKAVLSGAAAQMGFDVLQEDGETKEEALPKEESKDEAEESAVLSHETFGFVKDHDVALDKDEATDSKRTIRLDEERKEETEAALEETTQEEGFDEDFEEKPTQKPKAARKPLPFLAGGASVLSLLRFPRLPIGGKFLFVLPLLLALCIAVLLAYIFGLKATVVLDVSSKAIEKKHNVVFSTEKGTDFQNNTIEARLISVSLNGTLSTPVSGKKETGEKAKGGVTVYSKLAQSKTLPQGTVMIGPNDTAFVFDKEVKIASSSADASAPASTATVPVTAKAIGKESNLPSGSKFTIEGFDQADLVAKNESAFSGGSKKEISVVNRSDLDKLVAQLPKNLEEKAKEDSSKKISSNESILPVLVNVIVDKKEFDKKVGDEAKTVTLKATVTYEDLSYQKDAVIAFAKHHFKDELTGMRLAGDGVSYELSSVRRISENEVSASVLTKALLVPAFDSQKLAQDVASKSFDEARVMLSKLPQVQGATIAFSPNLPFLPKYLPRLSENISVIIRNE